MNKFAFGTLCVTSMSALVQADEPVHRLSNVRFETSQWCFQPVYDETTGLVDAVVAIAKPDATIGDNLNTILFVRDGNSFEAWSWRNATRARAVYSAKLILEIPEEDDALWMLEEEFPWLDPDPVRPPTPYEAGMLTDDPLFEPVMGSDNPQALVDLLASMGYSSTSLRIGDGGGHTNPPPIDGCEIFLLTLAGATEWALTQDIKNDDLAEVNALGILSMTASTSCGGCTPDAIVPGLTDTILRTDKCTFEFVRDNFNVSSGEHNCVYKLRKTYTEKRTRKLYADVECHQKDCVSTRSAYVDNTAELTCAESMSPCKTTAGPSICGFGATTTGNFCATAGGPPATGPGAFTAWAPKCGD